MTRPEIEAHVRAIDRRCRGRLAEEARVRVAELLLAGLVEEAKRIDRISRRPCGHDFNEIILAGALDGERHEYRCPSCKADGVYIAPFFEDAEPAALEPPVPEPTWADRLESFEHAVLHVSTPRWWQFWRWPVWRRFSPRST